MSRNIKIEQITRVEGHGNIVLNLDKGRVEELRLEIVESPRFFELMLKGRGLEEAPHITSRICGICAISHTTASLKASEALLGVQPPRETVALRKILLNAETIQSHVLHLFFLALPDFFSASSIMELADKEPETVKCALRLKRAANEVCRVLVGRHVHPIGMVVGGFMRPPAARDLDEVRVLLEGAREELDKMVSIFAGIEVPELERETTNVSLKASGEYALYDGIVYSSDGTEVEPSRYRELITEEVVAYSTAKHAKVRGGAIMVGALSRFNNNFGELCDEAKGAAKRLALVRPSANPFMINKAQVVETVHCIYDSLRLIEKLIDEVKGGKGAWPSASASAQGGVEARAGSGVGAVEAPRGTLYHEYETDGKGVITAANCVIPTAQNLLNIEKDIEAMVPEIASMTKKAITGRLEMLVRAYDPCISCSTHLLKVRFV